MRLATNTYPSPGLIHPSKLGEDVQFLVQVLVLPSSTRDSAIIDGIGKPFYRGGVPRFFDGCLCGFGRCKAIENIRRYTPVKGIVVRQVGADAETITHVVRNTRLAHPSHQHIQGHLFDSSNQRRFRTQA